MTMIIRQVLFAFTFWLILAGCKSTPVQPGDRDTPQQTSGPLFPMGVGYSWVVKSLNLDSNGVAVYQQIDTITIRRDSLIAGELWYDMLPRGWFAVRTDGLWMRWTPDPFRRFPIVVGDSAYTGYDTYIKLLGNDAIVEVPAGKYYAHEYVETYPASGNVIINKYYFVRGIGQVKREVYSVGVGWQTYAEILMDYHLE